MPTPITRRRFGQFAAAAAASSFLPARAKGAGERVNVAIIGCGGMGGADGMRMHKTGLVNVVALCDVALGTPHTAGVEEAFPDVPRYKDFRQMFDELADHIDACTIGVPDHSHFPIAILAMSLGKAVYVEKPLAHTFDEISRLIEAERKYGVICQMGNQGHSGANYHQFKAWREAGVIRDITRVTAYMNSGRRWHPWEFDEYPEDQPMPEELDWDTWTGTRPEAPYSDKLHPGNWRSWFDYGSGAFGDWGPHILDTTHRFLDLGLPTKVEAEMRDGPRERIYPMASTIRFDFPARGLDPACEVTWLDGTQNRPERPEEFTEEMKLGGAGKLLFSENRKFHGGTHWAPLTLLTPEEGLELPEFEVGSNHYLNFILSVKGEEETRSPFHVAGPLCQVFCLGVIAQRLGGVLEFDRGTQQITNDERANELLVGPPPREGWEEFYRL